MCRAHGRRSMSQHVRSERSRSGAAPEDQHLQRRSRLFTGDGWRHVVHGQRLRPPGSPDIHAQCGPLRRSTGKCRQDRKLTNFGVKADVAYTVGAHNVKFGGTISATKLDENVHHRLHRSGVQCARQSGLQPGPRCPYDLTRGGRRSPTHRRRRSNSRPRTFRTTSRPEMPTSSLACASITTTASRPGRSCSPGWASRMPFPRAIRCCARPTGAHSRLRTTRTCCCRAAWD